MKCIICDYEIEKDNLIETLSMCYDCYRGKKTVRFKDDVTEPKVTLKCWSCKHRNVEPDIWNKEECNKCGKLFCKIFCLNSGKCWECNGDEELIITINRRRNTFVD